MTASEALRKVRRATVGNTNPDPDMLTFGGWNVVEALRAAKSAKGDRNTFVVDGTFTVRFFDGEMFVSGPHKE